VFALAENAALPRIFAAIHPAWRTPHVAIWFTSAVTLALALTGSFALLAAGSAVTRLLTYAGVSGATLVLRHHRFDDVVPRAAYTVPLGPIVPLVALTVSLAIVVTASTAQWLFGVGALAFGTALYVLASAAGAGRPSGAQG
jgi:amino acid transporter